MTATPTVASRAESAESRDLGLGSRAALAGVNGESVEIPLLHFVAIGKSNVPSEGSLNSTPVDLVPRV